MPLPVFTEKVRKRNCCCLPGCMITPWVGLDNTSEWCVKKMGGSDVYENSQTKMLKGDKVVNTKVQGKHMWRLLLISTINNASLKGKKPVHLKKRKREQKVTDVFVQNVYFTIEQLNESYII